MYWYTFHCVPTQWKHGGSVHAADDSEGGDCVPEERVQSPEKLAPSHGTESRTSLLNSKTAVNRRLPFTSYVPSLWPDTSTAAPVHLSHHCTWGEMGKQLVSISLIHRRGLCPGVFLSLSHPGASSALGPEPDDETEFQGDATMRWNFWGLG